MGKIDQCSWCEDPLDKEKVFYDYKDQPICWPCLDDATKNGQAIDPHRPA